MLAWITPDEPPGDDICIRVYCPSGETYEASLRGAILSLTETENWEKVGTQDVEVVAAAFDRAFGKTLRWERCMPTGAVLFFTADSVPDGFLACDGASYDTEEYQALFDVIGYTFGGSGSDFNVPNMGEKFPLAAGGAVAVADTGGQATVALTEDNNGIHRHQINATIVLGPGTGPIPIFGFSATPFVPTDWSGAGTPHDNIPPYIGLKAVISYR